MSRYGPASRTTCSNSSGSIALAERSSFPMPVGQTGHSSSQKLVSSTCMWSGQLQGRSRRCARLSPAASRFSRDGQDMPRTAIGISSKVKRYCPRAMASHAILGALPRYSQRSCRLTVPRGLCPPYTFGPPAGQPHAARRRRTSPPAGSRRRVRANMPARWRPPTAHARGYSRPRRFRTSGRGSTCWASPCTGRATWSRSKRRTGPASSSRA